MRLMAGAVMAMSMLAGAAHAGEWRVISSNQTAADFLDIASMRTLPGNKKLVWTAIGWAQMNDGGDYMVIQKEFDCNSGTEAMRFAYIYDGSDKVIRSGAIEEDAKPLAPDSIGYAMFEAVCEQGSYGPSSFANVRQGLDNYRQYIRAGN